MKRITINNLNTIILKLNRLTDNPGDTYTISSDGKYTANIGNFHLESAYGGYKLIQMQSACGGTSDDILHTGFVPKRTLYNSIQTLIRGIELATRK